MGVSGGAVSSQQGARAKLTGTFNAEDAPRIFSEVFRPDVNRLIYNFKHFPAPQGGGFDYRPRLIREEVEVRPQLAELGEAEIVLNPSDHEPWAEVEIVRVLGAIYTINNISMLKGSVAAEVDSSAFARYAFLKWDL